MSELLDTREFHRPGHQDHASLTVGHIATSVGRVTFLREQPSTESRDEFYFIGGLLSGAAYHMPACEIAQMGHSATTIRHANAIYDENVLEKDAAEIAESVEALAAPDSRVHFIGHSKGTKVALKAAAMLDEGIDLASVAEVNPVIGQEMNSYNYRRRMLGAPRMLGRIMNHLLYVPWTENENKRATRHEIFHRFPAIVAETQKLLTSDGIHKPDLDAVRARKGGDKTAIIMAYGLNDTMTHPEDIERVAAAEKMEFESVMRMSEPGFDTHLSIIQNPDFIRAVASEQLRVVKEMRSPESSSGSHRFPRYVFSRAAA